MDQGSSSKHVAKEPLLADEAYDGVAPSADVTDITAGMSLLREGDQPP